MYTDWLVMSCFALICLKYRYNILVKFQINNQARLTLIYPKSKNLLRSIHHNSMTPHLSKLARSVLGPVSYTHLTLPTNREV